MTVVAESFVSSEVNRATTSRTVAITGASGMVGQALSGLLKQRGDRSIAVSRSEGDSYEDSIRWNPESGLINPARMEGVDAVVHLAGENIASGRWTDDLKRRILNSRVQGTKSLVESLAKIEKRPSTFICASAIGFYGDRGETIMAEDSPAGKGFLADVCQAWEAEAMQAEALGMRVVCVRIGVVLSPKGGALARMLLPFKMGMGGNVGNGKQYWSLIGLNDLVRIFAYCLDNDQLSGPVNAVSPQPLTNAEFTKVVGSVLHRPTLFPLPAFMAKLVLGEMANELLLSSTRVNPGKLLKSGFAFEQPELKQCLEHELGMSR